ncbi:MAG TPA: radical SAM protein [Candidatus Omnitrophica bacterium]|nr:radical SAM protein [Candidatus Omnitrophota bacterium]
MALPSYIDAFKSGGLHKKAETALSMLESCAICPRKCGINRLKDEKGFCRTGRNALVCSYFAHHGEEPAISGTKGSGTIFFSRCNLKCLYCQNYDFSQLEEGRKAGASELAGYMLELQELGCHNINFVTPTHVMPQILEALILAVRDGLHIPLVYNTSGYELPEMIRLLDGIIDIYLPDMRYADNAHAARYSLAPDYPEFNQRSVKEMFDQVGIAKFDENDIIERGLIIRHLVLPQDLSSTEQICAFIAKKLSPQVYISLMSQYQPCFEAESNPPLDRRITREEYARAVSSLKKYGLENGWVQESHGLERFAGTNIKRNI